MKKTLYALAIIMALPAVDALAGPRDGLGGGGFGGKGGFGGGAAGGGNHEAMRQKMKERMKEADTNGDGAVSKAEFLAKAEERFNKIDKNGDGKLSPEDHKGGGKGDKLQKLKEMRGEGKGADDGETFP